VGLGAKRTRTSLIVVFITLLRIAKVKWICDLLVRFIFLKINTSELLMPDHLIAIQDISTLTSLGNRLTSTVSRAGGSAVKYLP
jgi:hypothetical protein